MGALKYGDTTHVVHTDICNSAHSSPPPQSIFEIGLFLLFSRFFDNSLFDFSVFTTTATTVNLDFWKIIVFAAGLKNQFQFDFHNCHVSIPVAQLCFSPSSNIDWCPKPRLRFLWINVSTRISNWNVSLSHLHLENDLIVTFVSEIILFAF